MHFDEALQTAANDAYAAARVFAALGKIAAID